MKFNVVFILNIVIDPLKHWRSHLSFSLNTPRGQYFILQYRSWQLRMGLFKVRRYWLESKQFSFGFTQYTCIICWNVNRKKNRHFKGNKWLINQHGETKPKQNLLTTGEINIGCLTFYPSGYYSSYSHISININRLNGSLGSWLQFIFLFFTVYCDKDQRVYVSIK